MQQKQDPRPALRSLWTTDVTSTLGSPVRSSTSTSARSSRSCTSTYPLGDAAPVRVPAGAARARVAGVAAADGGAPVDGGGAGDGVEGGTEAFGSLRYEAIGEVITRALEKNRR